MAEALDRSNCGIARSRGKEAAVKPVSRRTEMPFKADGVGKLAQHSNAPCSASEVNGAVAQAEFASLLREICSPSPAVASGAASSNGRREGAEVSRGRSTESNEPGADERPAKTKRPDGLTTREGLNLAGSGDPGRTGTGDDAERLSLVQSHRGRDRALRYPSGLLRTAGRGPACPVVWEPGGAIPPATRLADHSFFAFTGTK
jgi:hypothetical protein